MPGSITLKPLEANFHNENESILKGTPYCMFTMGSQRVQGKKSEKEGGIIHWNDSVTLKMHNSQPTCFIELKQEGDSPSNNEIAKFEVDLSEIESQGKLKRWYPFFSQDKLAGQILMEAVFNPDVKDPESLFHKKSHQGSAPHGIDLDEYAREEMRWRMEPKNSIAKIAETNEFGDYQPHKQLPFGDILHERGSGMIGQGTYYSGQQTSYGEDFPMSHKSVGTNQFGRDDHGAAYDRANPRDYALFQQQAFEPHNFDNLSRPNPSIIEKVYQTDRSGNIWGQSERKPEPLFKTEEKTPHSSSLIQQSKEKIDVESQNKMLLTRKAEREDSRENIKNLPVDNEMETSTRPSTASSEFHSLHELSKHNWDI